MQIQSPVLLLLAIVFLGACEQNEINRANVLKIGDRRGILVTTYNDTLSGDYYKPVTTHLDLDYDGLIDFEMYTGIFGSPGSGMYPIDQIRCMHANCLILGEIRSDTIFVNSTTRVIPPDDWDPRVQVITDNLATCERMSEADWILTIENTFVLTLLNEDESIPLLDEFMADTIDLHHGTSHIFEPGPITQDTVFARTWTTISCNPFPRNEAKYIGFKIETDKHTRLGWLKIEILWNGIFLVESAIQM